MNSLLNSLNKNILHKCIQVNYISPIIHQQITHSYIFTNQEPAPQEKKSPPMDNELDRYLNRSYWEQRQQQQKDEGTLSPSESRSSPTPSAPISNAAPPNLNNYAARITEVSFQRLLASSVLWFYRKVITVILLILIFQCFVFWLSLFFCFNN